MASNLFARITYNLRPQTLCSLGYLIKVTFVLIKSFIEKLVAISSHYCHSKRTTIPPTEISQHNYTMQTNVKDLQENKFIITFIVFKTVLASF